MRCWSGFRRRSLATFPTRNPILNCTIWSPDIKCTKTACIANENTRLAVCTLQGVGFAFHDHLVKLNSVSASLKSHNRVYELARTESEIRVNDYNPTLLLLQKANRHPVRGRVLPSSSPPCQWQKSSFGMKLVKIAFITVSAVSEFEVCALENVAYIFQTHNAPNLDRSREIAITSLPRPCYTLLRNDGRVNIESHSTFMTVSHTGAPHTQ